jgi:hypothetical protein
MQVQRRECPSRFGQVLGGSSEIELQVLQRRFDGLMRQTQENPAFFGRIFRRFRRGRRSSVFR